MLYNVMQYDVQFHSAGPHSQMAGEVHVAAGGLAAPGRCLGKHAMSSEGEGRGSFRAYYGVDTTGICRSKHGA